MRLTGRHPAVETFVRETLGCGCPQEAFEHIEDSGPGDLRRIAVGGRLLVYLIAPPTGVVAVDRLAEYLTRGRRERDELGFHRLRLVIAAGDGTADPGTLVLAFERLRAGDERLHLHLVAADALPPD